MKTLWLNEVRIFPKVTYAAVLEIVKKGHGLVQRQNQKGTLSRGNNVVPGQRRKKKKP